MHGEKQRKEIISLLSAARNISIRLYNNKQLLLDEVFVISGIIKVGVSAGGGTLGISGWGCAAGTLEPLAYTRASSAKFCYPILE